jgi:hypothetical protein
MLIGRKLYGRACELLKSCISRRSEESGNNAASLQAQVDDLRGPAGTIAAGGDSKSRERHLERISSCRAIESMGC